jgi:hypothetical protein
MFCGECGTQNPDTNQFCKNCGKPLRRPQQAQAPPQAPAPVIPTAAPQPVYTQPVYTPPPAGYPPGAAAPSGPPVKPPLNKGLLVLGILGIIAGIVSWFRYPYLLGLLAVVLGGVAIARTENKKGAVAIIAIIAILVGLGCIVFDLFYLTILPPAEPNL